MELVETKYFTASGIITNKPYALVSMHIGMDGTNNPTITVYKGTDNSGEEQVPTNSYKASSLGLTGFEGNFGKYSRTGGYFELTCSGDCEVVVSFKELKKSIAT